MELTALAPQNGVWSYQVRNTSSESITGVMIEHKNGYAVDAVTPDGWSVLSNNAINITWTGSLPPNGEALFMIRSNSYTPKEVSYVLTSTNSVRTGIVPVPTN